MDVKPPFALVDDTVIDTHKQGQGIPSFQALISRADTCWCQPRADTRWGVTEP